MKKFGIMVVVLAMLVGMTGFAMADPGINQTPETKGIGTTTVAQVQGSMISRTDVDIELTSDQALATVPPLNAGRWYISTYNEDTVSNGVGIIDYTKLMDVDTKNMNVNQYNIEAFKQIAFLGDGTSSMVTNENIFVEGTGWGTENARNWSMCVFAPGVAEGGWPPFCNSAEAGSSVDMLVGGVTTTTNDRFIMKTGDPMVVLNHNVRVIETIGTATAYMNVLGIEGRGYNADTPTAFQTIEFSETTTVSGLIDLFDKQMHYETALRR
jgi:hypothetical protein